MKIKPIDKELMRLSSEMKSKRAFFGARFVLKNLKNKKFDIKKIYITNDYPPMMNDILSKLESKKINLIKLNITKEVLREFLDNEFNVSVISIVNVGIKSDKNQNETKA